MNAIRVVLADDSALLRQVLQSELEATKRITVVGAAKNGKEAIALVKQLKPDVLILDCEMPVMNGLEALRHIMAECPMPVFMFSSLTSEGASVTITALEYGAVDFLLKPMAGVQGLDQVVDDLVRKIELIVVKERCRLMRTQKPAAGSGEVKKVEKPTAPQKRAVDLIAMGSSTGGVQAATKVVTKLPASTQAIVWVQHMPAGFTLSFANRLASMSQMKVKEAHDGDIIERGTCYLAPGGFQMRVKKKGARSQVSIQPGEKVSGHCPSCNVLFDSVAEQYSDNVVGVILTGMGDDGAKGLAKMHDRGAYVIGQDENSCVVYGMPKSAFQLGAVDVEVDVENIADMVVKAGGAGL